MSASLERLARNQALFREVNERIQQTAGNNTRIEFVCECSDTECIETIDLRLTDYEQIRADPLRFVIKPGHEIDAIERVISEDGGSAVVEKHKAEDDLIQMDTPRRRGDLGGPRRNRPCGGPGVPTLHASLLQGQPALSAGRT